MTIACQAKGGINLGQGVCDLPTPPPVARGAIRAIEDQLATYAHPMGIAELRQAVAKKVQSFYGVTYDPNSEVVITSGATGGFAASVLALCEPGDEIILFEPYYGYHLNTVLSLGLKAGAGAPATTDLGHSERSARASGDEQDPCDRNLHSVESRRQSVVRERA